MLRRLGRIARYLGLALLGVLILLYVTLINPLYSPLRDALLPPLTRMIAASWHGTLEIDSLRGSLLSAPVFHNIVLRDAHNNVVVHIEALRLAYDLAALFRGRLAVQTVEMVRPQVTLVQQPDGRLNLSTIVPPSATPAPEQPAPSGGLPFALHLDALRIRDGQMTLDLPTLPGVQHLTGLQVHLGAQMAQAGLRVQLHQLSARALPADVTLHTLQGLLTVQDGVTRVEDFRLQTGATLVTVHGVLPGGGIPADFALQVQPLALSEIGRVLQNELLRDPVQLTLHAAGPPAALQVQGQFSTPAARVDVQGHLNTAALPMQYQAQINVAHLDLAALVGRADLQSDLNLALHVEGAGVALHELQSALRVEIHPSHLGPVRLRPSLLHLQAVQQRVQLQRLDLDTSVAHVTASGALDLTGAADVHYALTADLAGLQQLLGTQALAGAVRLKGQAQGTWPALHVDGTLHAEALRYEEQYVQALQLTYAGTQLGTQPHLTAKLLVQQVRAGTFPLERIVLEATYTEATRQAQFGLDVFHTAETGGNIHGTLQLGATEHRVSLEDVRLKLPQRLWRAAAPWRIVLGAQQITFEQIHLAHAEESFSLSGTVAGDSLQDVQLTMTQLDVSYLQQLLQLPPAVGGRADLRLGLAGTLAAPRVQSEWLLRAPSQSALPFESLRGTLAYAERHLEGSFQVQQSRREVLAFDLRLPLDLAFTGLTLGQRLLDAPVDIRLALKQPDLAALQRAQPALPKLQGTLQGSVTLQGTYAALSLGADVELQQLGLAGSVEQLRGPIRLSAELLSASSVAVLAHAIEQGQVTPQLQRVTLRVPGLSGTTLSQETQAQPFQVHNLDLQAAAQWRPEGLHATLQRLHVQTTGFGLPRTDVVLTADLEPQRLTLHRLQVRLPQSELQMQGWLTLPEQLLHFRCEIPRLRLDDLPLSLPPHFPPLLQGSVTVRGSVPTPQIEATLQYAGGRLRADLGGQLQEPLPRYQAAVHLESLDLAQLLPGAKGRLQATLRMQGVGWSGDKRQAHLEMSAEAPELNLAPGLTVRLQANLAGDTLQVPRFQVRSTPLEVAANGTLSATQTTAFDYRLTLGDLRPVGQYLGMELQGKGGLTGKVQGTNGVLQTQSTLQGTDWRLGSMRLPRLLVDFAATQLLTTPQATLKAQLHDLQGPSLPPSSLRLDIARTPQQGHFTILVTKGPYEKTTLAGTLLPTAQSQRVTLKTVRLQQQRLAWENVGPINLVHFDQGEVRVESLTMRSGMQELTMQGSFVPNGALQADLQLRQVQIRPTVHAFLPTADVPDGRLSLTAMARGTVQAPQIQSELQLTELQWRQQKLGEMRATLEHQGSTVRTDLRWQEQGALLLHVHGSLGLGTPGAVDVRLEAPAFDLARVSALTPAVTQSAGVLSFDLHLTGTPHKPQLLGQLAVRDGVLQLAAAGERYRDIQARLQFVRDRLEIEQFQLGSRSGPLHLTGRVDYTDLTVRHLDLAVRADHFTALHTPAIEAVIATDIQARGPLEALTLNGRLSVPRARLITKHLPGGGPKAVEPWELTVPGVYGRAGKHATTATAADGTSAGPVSPLSSLRADLQIDIPRNAWVQGPGTAVEMRGDVQVTKERNAPFILSGTVETVRGFASFYGKKFELAQGQVVFTGTPEINPLLDVTVTRKVSDYVVMVHAGGKALQPEIVLSSTPPLDQMDILSLLVAGKTTDKLTSSEQGSFAKQAQQIAGAAVASELGGALGDTLGLDTVELTTDSAKVGRYVTQDLFLSYERGLGGKNNGSTVGAEYSLSRRMKLKGTSSDTGESALDLFWFLDF